MGKDKTKPPVKKYKPVPLSDDSGGSPPPPAPVPPMPED